MYYYSVSTENIKAMYDWLDKDLAEANQPENREKRPWVIVMGHKPMYCSNDDGLCRDPNNPVRCISSKMLMCYFINFVQTC